MMKIGEFSKKIGVSIETLRRWDKEGKLKPAKVTYGGVRLYSDYQYKCYMGEVEPYNRAIIGYALVTPEEGEDALEEQIRTLVLYMSARGYKYELLKDVGSSADLERVGLTALLCRVLSGEVDKVVVYKRERLLGYAFEFFKRICDFFDTEIEILNSSTDEKEVYEEDLHHLISICYMELGHKRVQQILSQVRS